MTGRINLLQSILFCLTAKRASTSALVFFGKMKNLTKGHLNTYELIMFAKYDQGMKQVWEETGVDTCGMTTSCMKQVLGSHPDFKDQKSKVEIFLNS